MDLSIWTVLFLPWPVACRFYPFEGTLGSSFLSARFPGIGVQGQKGVRVLFRPAGVSFGPSERTEGSFSVRVSFPTLLVGTGGFFFDPPGWDLVLAGFEGNPSWAEHTMMRADV